FNGTYGRLLLVCMLVHTPLNALFLMMLCYSPMSAVGQASACAITLGQIIVLWLISYFSALLSLKIHRPAKVFLRLVVKCKKRRTHWSLRSQLKLATYVEQFHTTNLYTVNYGKGCGKITLAS